MSFPFYKEEEMGWDWGPGQLVSEGTTFLRTSLDLWLLFGTLDFLVLPTPPTPLSLTPPEVPMVSLQTRSDKPVEDENNSLTFINIQYWIWKGLNLDTRHWG